MDSEDNCTRVQTKEEGEGCPVIPKKETNSSVEQTGIDIVPVGELFQNSNMSRSNIEPPAFISDKKSYAEYKADLNMWSRITSLDKKVQAETVVYRLEGHPSRIKEKILTQLGDKLQDNENGIKELIDFLDKIYNKDDMADAWDKFSEFASFTKKPDQNMDLFISEWENSYHKAKKVGCVYSDMILAFKLLKDAKLNDIETKLVLTGVNYVDGKANKDLCDQIKRSLKKFQGRSVILEESCRSDIAGLESVLIAKGWKPPTSKQRRRSRSESPRRQRENTPATGRSVSPSRARSEKYRGRKNPLEKVGKVFLPKKCFLCKCKHTTNCNCPCVYHFAPDCPGNKKKPEKTNKADLGLFMKTNVENQSSGDDSDAVFIVEESLEELILVTTEEKEALVDCACPNTVAGKKWIEDFCSELDDDEKSRITVSESEKVFKFGGGEKRKSLGKVVFPCHIGEMNIKISAEVIEADLPLLLGNSFLKKIDAVLYIAREKAMIMGKETKMRETPSGHFSIQLELPRTGVEYCRTVECLISSIPSENNNELTLENIEKLHHYFGHRSKQLAQLIKNSNKYSETVQKLLDQVESKCTSCKLNQKSKPKPKVAFPRATKCNEVVSLDLKEYKSGAYKYIMYAVDLFSRFTVGGLITDKKPATVGTTLLEKWVAPMGLMKFIHSDRGGEFCCEELTEIAEYLGVRSTFTAAYSPNQNGTNERNHAIVDSMIVKMRMHDPDMPASIALTWALMAKNTLQNISGFSPFQIVFGQNPVLPSVYAAGPSGLEEAVMAKSVAKNINAMHLAREAYIAGESDKVLKAALKDRIYTRGNNIKIGNWIYFKNNGRWQGPVKVAGKDGKSLYVVRGGKFLTVNTDHADVANFEGELKETSQIQENKSKDLNETTNTIAEQEKGEINNACGEQEINNACGEQENIDIQNDPEIEVDEQENEISGELESDFINVKDISKNDIVAFKRRQDDMEWEKVKIDRRAGKVGGKYEQWWNTTNLATGHKEAQNFGEMAIIKKVKETNPIREDEVLVMTIPRYLHGERRCQEAKEKEFKAWDNYEVYKEVKDQGQPRLGTNWVLTEKIIDGEHGVKARLTVRGDQEDTTNVRKDSPTVRKGNIKIFCAVAAKEGWDIKTNDVTCAFLQGAPMEREVFILPPKERRIPGVLWLLKKPVYGLADAARGWHLALDKELTDVGFEKSKMDPAMYLFFSEDDKKIEGITLTHVDDLLDGGTFKFENEVMKRVKDAFEFSDEEAMNFRYVGMNMIQKKNGIVINQDHYVESLELPDMQVAANMKSDDVLCPEGQAEFRGCVAKILYIGSQSRPDVCFEGKALSTKFGKATKGDLRLAARKIQKLKGSETIMFFPDLGAAEEWSLVAYCDAGIKSLPDKINSVGGQVILLVNIRNGTACVLNWRSKKLKRKVVSSLAGEALAMVAVIGEVVYNKAILSQIYGETVDQLPVIVFTDSKNLQEAIYSSSLVDDAWLIPDVAVIKEAIDQGTVSDIRRVSGRDMIANCLTKPGASAEDLLHILHTGRYNLPDGVQE